jgi:oligopeptidase A
MTNPLLTPGDTAAFAHLDAALVDPAIEAAIADVRTRRDALLASVVNDAAFVLELDRLTDRLEWAYGVVAHLESVLPDPALREALGNAQPKASAVWASLATDEALYARLIAFRASPYGAAITGAEARLVDKTIEGLRRSGAALPPEERARLQAIDVRLGELGLAFSQHVVDDADAWSMVVEAEEELRGVPATYVGIARAAAEKAGLAGYKLTLSAPLVTAVLSYA